MGFSDPQTSTTSPIKFAIGEALKEVARYLVSIGVIDALIGLFQLFQTMVNPQTGAININWQIVLGFTALSFSGAVLRGLDKLKHVYEQTITPEPGVSKGIIPF